MTSSISRISFRYLRYMPPPCSYGNIAELEFDGGVKNVKLIGTPFASVGPSVNYGKDFTKVFDGNLDTFFDASMPTNSYVGIDLKAPAFLPQPPVRMLPAAPAGLTATSQYTTDCAKTGGVAMPHIALSWKLGTGASYYTVYRNGVAVQVGVTPCGWTDMDITSGQSYSYALSATGPGGEGPRCAPVTVTAPVPQAGTLLTPPANLCVTGLWLGSTANVLSWQPVAGAAGYNVYVSDVRVASGLTTPTFTITSNMLWRGALFTVTSVDGSGMESIPSAPTGYMYAYDPAAPPMWTNYMPDAPTTLAAVPGWNQGGPRIQLIWHGQSSATSYNVYRDGVKVASGLWRPYYLDSNVSPGATHTYKVTSLNNDEPATIESLSATPVTATALDGPPAPLSSGIVITKVISNDDSAEVFFTPIPGATDYRIYDVRNPAKVKYAGQITYQVRETPAPERMALSIEWNGIDPAVGADLVVEAVDKFGPFQRMDGAAGFGAMRMSSLSGESFNGQGDPSNVPLVLARSSSFHVTCSPFSLTGQQAFFDTFHTSQPFVLQPNPTVVPVGSQYYGSPNDYAAYDNDKWEARQYGADLTNSKFFAMDGHFMDTTYDGGGPGSSNPAHNNVASMVMMPKATADISGGKVLHVTFEVDAHFDGRRWVEVGIGEAGDELINIAKFETHNLGPTISGKFLRWQIQSESNSLNLYPAIGGAFSQVDLIQNVTGQDIASVARTNWDHVGPFANGTMQDIDKRHRFDLYLSKTHYRIQESTPDGQYNVVREKDFPAGYSLPFNNCQVYFVHQVYHTANDRSELMTFYPYETYWYTQRPYADERHWDNMGFEILDSFPGE